VRKTKRVAQQSFGRSRPVGLLAALALLISCGEGESPTAPPDRSPPSIVTSSLPDGVVRQAYSQTLVATGGDGSFSWSLSTGSVPVGLTLSAGGLIAGSPALSETATFTVEVVSAGQSATKSLSITIQAPVPPPSIATSSLPDGVVGQAYNQTLAAAGGDGAYAWSLRTGAVPVGLSLSPGGIITGTPTQSETATFTVEVVSGGQMATKSLSITVQVTGSPPSIVTTSLPEGTVGQAYNQTLVAAGGDGSYSWSLSTGSVPVGLSLSVGGVIAGTAAQSETATFTVEVVSAGQSATKSLSITIQAPVPPPSITTSSLPDGTVGQAYDQSLAATGGDGSYAWSLNTGSIPVGLTLSAGGVIAGSPTQSETATFTVEVVSAGQLATRSLSITVQVAGSPPSVTTNGLPDGAVGQAYNQTLAATGGDGFYAWSLNTGSVPAGLSLSASGVIAGSPTQSETATFTVQVSSAGQVATRSLSITIQTGSPSAVASVEVVPGASSLLVGQSVTLTAIPRDMNGNVLNGRAVAWTTSNSAVADGVVQGDQAAVVAFGLGAATIYATTEGVTGFAVVLVPGPLTCSTVAGGEIYAEDSQYLGRLTNQFDAQSILNTFGSYGSAFSSTSMFNQFSQYGSPFSALSAYNTLALTPPRLYVNGFFVAYVTKNSLKTPLVDPDALRGCPF
jgi:Putative Ig domain